MAVALSEVESCDSSIPDELTSIDALKCSEECRLGRYLIELAFERSLKVSPWDETFFRLARQLYLHLNQRQKKSLAYSYCFSRVLPSVIAIFPVARRAVELYNDGRDLPFIEFILDTEAQIGEQLELIDHEFLYSRQEGSDANDLEYHLTQVIGSSTCRSPLRRGHLKGEKIGRFWHVPYSEVLRAVRLARNWVAVKKYGIASRVNPDEFCRFAISSGYQIEVNLSRAKSIRKSEAPIVLEAYKRSKEGSRNGTRSFRRFAKKGELSTEEFADLFQTSGNTVRNWIGAKHIKAIRRKSCLFVKMGQDKLFAAKVVNNKVTTCPEIAERCRRILAES